MKRENVVVVIVVGIAMIVMAVASTMLIRNRQSPPRPDGVVRNNGRAALEERRLIDHFMLTDTDGTKVSPSSLRGAPYVIGFLFANCGWQCPQMTTQLKKLHDQLADLPEVKILWVTIDPANDSNEILDEMGKKHDIDRKRWRFLRGSKQEVAQLSQKGFLLSSSEEGKGLHHSGRVALVDAQGRLVAYYDAYGGDRLAAMKQLQEDIRALVEGRPLVAHN